MKNDETMKNEDKMKNDEKLTMKNDDEKKKEMMKKIEMFEKKIHYKEKENSNVKMKKKIQTKLGPQMKILSQSPNSPITKKKMKKQIAQKIDENLRRVGNLTPEITKNLPRKLKNGRDTLCQKSIWDFWHAMEEQQKDGTQH